MDPKFTEIKEECLEMIGKLKGLTGKPNDTLEQSIMKVLESVKVDKSSGMLMWHNNKILFLFMY